ncbi:hypothetical protein N9T85_00455, partial [bacterium]|nr:hypothetical protein [bacterium]
MKKIIALIVLSFLLSGTGFAESYYFKKCKLSNAVSADYIINFDKKLIEVTLKSVDGKIQQFADKIKLIEKNQIVTEKIESGKGDNIYFEYYLNSENSTVTKLQYKRQGDNNLNIFKIQSSRKSDCENIRAGWNKEKIKKAEVNKEQEQILKAQEKIKKEKNTVIKCPGNDHKNWTNCNGVHKTSTGYRYEGIFKDGTIVRGEALFPGGSKYIGEFKNFKPHGYGNFSWSNGDKYFGEWKDGKNYGNGTKIWSDGREYSGDFKNDQLDGEGTLYYPDGKKYTGDFLKGKRHGEGTFEYKDGTAFIGKFIDGKQQGMGTCVRLDGSTIPCKSKSDSKTQSFANEDALEISIIAKRWVRISQYETNTKRGKKIM